MSDNRPNVNANELPPEVTRNIDSLWRRTGIDRADVESYLAEAWANFEDPKVWYTVAYRRCVDHRRREHGRTGPNIRTSVIFDSPAYEGKNLTTVGDLLINAHPEEECDYSHVETVTDLAKILVGLPDDELAALFRHYWLKIPNTHPSQQVVCARALRHAKNQRAQKPSTGQTGPLAPKQIEVLTLAARGLSVKLIALEMDRSTNTVKRHLELIAKKLNSNNTTHSVAIAIQAGWIRL